MTDALTAPAGFTPAMHTGYLAQRAGMLSTDNPHQIGTRDRAAWADGWVRGEMIGKLMGDA